jgi:hypothetical protein
VEIIRKRASPRGIFSRNRKRDGIAIVVYDLSHVKADLKGPHSLPERG